MPIKTRNPLPTGSLSLRMTLVGLCVVALTLSAGGGVAWAAEENEDVFLGNLPEINHATAVAFDQAGSTVLVADKEGELGSEVKVFPGIGGAVVAKINGSETPQGSFAFSRAGGLAVDGAGDVYVGDGGNDVIDKFEPKGPNPSEGYRYVCQYSGYGRGCMKDPQLELGTPSTFGDGIFDDGTGGITVDQAGNLYATDPEKSQLDEFNAAGGDVAQIIRPKRQFGIGFYESPTDVAVDASGNIYLVEEEHQGAKVVDELQRGVHGEILGEKILSDNAAPLALDSLTLDANSGSLFLLGQSRVFEYDPAHATIDSEFNVSAPFQRGGENIAAQGTGGSLTSRVYVWNEDNNGIEIYGPPPPLKPVAHEESVADVTVRSARLNAVIEPELRRTRYVFQFGTDQSYSGGEIPLVPGEVGSSNTSALVNVLLDGLTPGATYHYRVVATNKVGTTYGPGETFTTFQAGESGLPDGRVWEMVSPLDKNGGDVLGNTGGYAVQASADGEKVTYDSIASFGAARGNPAGTSYLATRGQESWSTQNMFPSFTAGAYAVDTVFHVSPYKAFSLELAHGLIRNEETATGAPGVLSPPLPGTNALAGYDNLYMRNNETNSFQALITSTPTTLSGSPVSPSHFTLLLYGFTPDMSHIFVGFSDLSEHAAFGLDEWSNGVLKPVGVTAAGEVVPDAVLGSGRSDEGGLEAHMVSNDGSRVFWSTAGQNPGERGPVFVREDGTRTVPLPPGEFLDASTTGSKALLSTGEVFDVDGERRLADLTGGAGGFVGELGASEDLSRIYFIDTAALAGAGKNSLGQAPQVGESNLYLYREGSPSPSFIGTLAQGDSTDWSSAVNARTARVTPDGETALFQSSSSLTGYDNRDAATESRDSEIFVYHASTGVLACVSCDPSGERPISSTNIPTGSVPYIGLHDHWYQPRALSADGRRVFFETPEALVTQDTNGANDVYEYEEGRVRLISSGTGSSASFLDASESGNSVFFTTENQLVPGDTDQLVDLYDARVNGGFPSPPVAPQCTGTGCQGVPAAPPIFATPSSVTFGGVGNFETAPATAVEPKPKPKARCAKDRRLSRGRCVEGKRKQKSKAKRTPKGRK